MSPSLRISPIYGCLTGHDIRRCASGNVLAAELPAKGGELHCVNAPYWRDTAKLVHKV